MITAERLSSRSIAYEPNFDRKLDVNLLEVNRNLETFLGERLNVLLSENSYKIKNDLIYGGYKEEPFINSIRRGVEYRNFLDGENRVDKKRERAEIDGFSFTQDVLCNPDTPIGTMVLSVSPSGEKGSSYGHNFYDVFTLKKENGEKYVEARRYSSALSNHEYKEKLKYFFPKIYGEDVPATDDYFLSHPVVIKNGMLNDPDEVHSYLHRNHEYMEARDFEQVLRACTPFINRYIKVLSENPNNIDVHHLILDAILNKADRVAEGIKNSGIREHDVFVRKPDSYSLDREIQILGNEPVRRVAAGCGSSNGFSNNNGTNNYLTSNPFGVSEFGSQEWFSCPKCNFKADGPVGDKCPGCGLTKESYAEESGEPVCD